MEKKELINELLSKINANKYRKLLSTLEDGYKGLYVILNLNSVLKLYTYKLFKLSNDFPKF